jgi:hypothetical protein
VKASPTCSNDLLDGFKTLKFAVRLVFILFVLLGASVCRAADWSLEIVPTHSMGDKVVLSSDNLTPDFYVVLTNLSNHPWKVWESWNSWGWWNLSFDVTRADGRKFRLRKGGGSWSWNGPDTFLVRSGMSFVMPVRFDERWTGFPDDWGALGDPAPVQITAVFEEHRDASMDKNSASPTEIAKLVSREDELRATLKESPYDSFAAHEFAKIEKRLYYNRIQEDLWTGIVRSTPMTAILQKAQKY